MLLIYIVLALIVGLVVGKLLFAKVGGIPQAEIDQRYVLKDLYAKLERDNAALNETIVNLSREVARQEEAIRNRDERLVAQKDEVAGIREQFTKDFENLSQKIFEAKRVAFVAENERMLGGVVNPLKEQLNMLRDKIESVHREEVDHVKRLLELNQQVSTDANNLALALKGESKTQGNWGEMQLERILELSGLDRGISYETQVVIANEEGKGSKPDFVVKLPDDRCLIVDSKVSLTAYEKYCSTEDKEAKAVYLKEHVGSVYKHIKELSEKKYQNLYQINQPDYLLMFLPVEAAYILALQTDSSLVEEALKRNIVLVPTSTLIATLKIISYLWKQEKQKKNVLEIARQSGLLYDKFVNFIDDMKVIESNLDKAKVAYADAMNKLVNGGRHGDTLVGRAEKIKQLGAQASKQLPQEFLQQDGDDKE